MSNPNHDQKGRFSSGAGEGGSTGDKHADKHIEQKHNSGHRVFSKNSGGAGDFSASYYKKYPDRKFSK